MTWLDIKIIWQEHRPHILLTLALAAITAVLAVNWIW